MEDALSQHQAGQLELAETGYRQILAEVPDHSDALYLLGTVLLQQQKFSESIECLESVLAVTAGTADTHNNIGVAYKAIGDWQQAAQSFQAALKANPHYSQALFNLGSLMQDRGLLDDAAKCFRHALQIKPDDQESLLGLANVTKDIGEYEESESYFRTALAADPENIDYKINLGYLLAKQKKFDSAIEFYQKVLADQPQFTEIYNSLSYIYEAQGKLDAAVEAAQQAIGINPDFAEGFNNLGTALKTKYDFPAAFAAFEKALKLNPQFSLAEFNLATTKLLQGDWSAGWPGYEKRADIIVPNVVNPVDQFSQPVWDGTPQPGKTILVHAEQGLGDSIQFVRFLPAVLELVGQVLLNVPATLKGLLSTAAGVDQVLTEGDELPEFDLQVPLLSLPGLLQTTIETVPNHVPYLHTEPQLVEFWKTQFAQIYGLKIGINWAGNPDFPKEHFRGLPLQGFKLLADMPAVTLISLQHGAGLDQLSELTDLFPLALPPESTDETIDPFLNTAAMIQNLDLVISSDTSVAHLAGALGRPVWLAVAKLAEWRWLLDRDDSPWYPTMKLFRQAELGCWDDVFEQFASEIKKT